jgi:hypothetical protein
MQQPREVWRPEAWLAAVQRRELCQVSWHWETKEEDWVLKSQALERKIVQVLMEVLVEEDWIWWNADKNQVATKSGKVTTVPRDGEAILEDGLWVWKPGDDGPILARAGGANLPIDGGGTASKD